MQGNLHRFLHIQGMISKNFSSTLINNSKIPTTKNWLSRKFLILVFTNSLRIIKTSYSGFLKLMTLKGS